MTKTDDTDEEASVLAKQGGITFFGSLLRRGLRFSFILIVTHFFTSSTYGVYTLSLSIVRLSQEFTSLSLNRSLDYYIPDFLSADRPDKAKGTLIVVTRLILTMSLLGALLLFILRGALSGFFREPGISDALALFAWSLPILTLDKVLYDFFKGTKQLRYRVYIRDIVDPLVRLGAIAVFIIFGWEVIGLVGGHMLGLLAGALVGVGLLYYRVDWLRTIKRTSVSRQSIVSYTLPLMFAGAIYTVISQVDYLVIGYEMTSSDIGHYRVAFFLTINMLIVLRSITPVFKPMVVEVRDDQKVLKRRFQVAARWSTILTLPIGITFLTIPGTLLSIVFTPEYVVASEAVMMLTVGYLFNATFGPDGMFLEGIGRTKITLLNSIIFIGINFILDVALVPRIGILGAATATASAMIVTGGISVIEIYVFRGIHPISIGLIKSWIAALPVVGSALLITSLVTVTAVRFVLIPAVIGIVYLGGLRTAGAFTQKDIELAEQIDARFGVTLVQRLVT